MTSRPNRCRSWPHCGLSRAYDASRDNVVVGGSPRSADATELKPRTHAKHRLGISSRKRKPYEDSKVLQTLAPPASMAITHAASTFQRAS